MKSLANQPDSDSPKRRPRPPAAAGPCVAPSTALRVLVLEDDVDDADLVINALREAGFEVAWERTEDRARFLEALTRGPDLVLSDYHLPRFTGVDALKLVRSQGLDVPFLLVSGVMEEDIAVEAMRNGADDYVLKDRLARLGEAVRRALERRRLRAQEQAALRETRRLVAIVENSNDAIVSRTLDGIVTSWNAGAERTFGYAASEAIGRPLADLILPQEVRARVDENARRTGHGEIVAPYETQRLTKDGTLLDVLASVSPIRNEAGKIVGAAIILRDISERKRAEAALRDSESRFRSFMRYLPGRAAMRDLEGRYTFVNETWLRAFGFNEADVVGQMPRDIFEPERAVALMSVHDATLARNEPLSRTLQIASGDLRKSWLSTHFPIQDATGRTIQVGTVARDVTEEASRTQKIEKLSRVRAFTSAINSLIVRVRNQRELFDEACRIAVGQGKFGMSWVSEIDPVSLDATPVAWAGDGVNDHVAFKSTARTDTPLGFGVVGQAVRTIEPAICNDLTAEAGVGSPRRQLAIRRGYRSLAGLPLIVDGTVKAVISLYATEANFFDDEEVVLLSEMAGNISFALENMAKQEKIEKLSRVRALTSQINAAIVRSHSRQDLFDAACRIAVEHGGFGIAWIGMVDGRSGDITPVSSAGLHAADFVRHARSSVRGDHPMGQGVAGRAVRERKSVFANDLLQEDGPMGARRREGIRLGFQSRVALPLLVDREVAAVFILYVQDKDFFTEEELKLMEELAGNISFALAHMARQEKVDKLSRIRAVSGEINAVIVRVRERDALLRETCRIASEHGKFSLAWVASLDYERQQVRPVAWAGFSAETAHAVTWASIEAAQGTLRQAIETQKPAVRNDIESDLPVGKLRQAALAMGCGSTVCLPLIVDGKVVSVVVLFAAGRHFFDDEELALLDELSADVSFALQTIARQEKLDYLSYYDTLTGLPNRTLFLDRAGQQLRGRASEQPLVAMILFNLERFRNINETFGRDGGDDLLRLVARRLEECFRGKDYIARVAADGFGVVIRGMRDAATVAHVVEKQVMECFREPFALDGSEVRVAAKAGIALFPADGEDADTLFKNAEAALKDARRSSESYLFYAAEMNARAAQALSLETRLRKAVEAQQFVLHYQPKISLSTGAIHGLEALIRWQEPGTGLVPPGQFIPLLEETGLILEVGRWVLKRALADHRAWTAAGLPAPRIAVNVSAVQLQRPDFADMVIETVHQEGDNPEALELEVTESLLMKDVQASTRKLSILRGLGVSIAMDDFGTGYSSLSYIARLPIDSLKIDRSFVNAMGAGDQDLAIVSTIVALARSLRLKVVAEGVETEHQAELLKSLLCDEAQGFLYSKPLPAGEIPSLLGAAERKHKIAGATTVG